jgi:SAM-dependent methyltransferase
MGITMRSAAAVIVLGACAHAPPAAPAAPPDVTQLSHAIIDAFDRGEAAVVEPQLSSGFVHAEGISTVRDRATDLAKLRERTPGPSQITKRTWSNEHVFVKGSEAVFSGEAIEQSAGRNGGYSYDGRYLLSWRYDDGAWKLALWAWNAKPAGAEYEFWNNVFKGGTGFAKEPNKLLVSTVASAKPGTALDIMMGQGRNALYLAEHGWHVTGIDWSHEGILQARATASAKGVPLETIEADVDTFDFGTAKYDLVSMIYAGADPKLVAKAQTAVKPGGLFVLEYFSSNMPNMDGPAPGALAKLFAGWDVVEDTVADGVPDWAMEHGTIQRFVARKR